MDDWGEGGLEMAPAKSTIQQPQLNEISGAEKEGEWGRGVEFSRQIINIYSGSMRPPIFGVW